MESGGFVLGAIICEQDLGAVGEVDDRIGDVDERVSGMVDVQAGHRTVAVERDREEPDRAGIIDLEPLAQLEADTVAVRADRE